MECLAGRHQISQDRIIVIKGPSLFLLKEKTGNSFLVAIRENGEYHTSPIKKRKEQNEKVYFQEKIH